MHMRGGDDDSLERLLAADEASLRDDGFTRKVMAGAGREQGLRRMTILAAGGAGALVACLSVAAWLGRMGGFSPSTIVRVEVLNFGLNVPADPAIGVAMAAALALACSVAAIGVARET
jgi:hypothetical protein